MADKYSKQINGYSYYGQHAEDLIISAIFAMIGIDKPSYIDLGTNHPIIDNNTFGMYVNGCRGINIEANPRLIGIIEEKRPEDININVGIGTKDELLPFYKWDDMSGRNTFCSSEIQYWGVRNPLKLSSYKSLRYLRLLINFALMVFRIIWTAI